MLNRGLDTNFRKRTANPTISILAFLSLAFIASQASAQGSPSSYATAAIDEIGSTGASSVALGVADYLFINDDGLGFGGTNTDSFDVGESTVLSFSTPLLNIPGQHDMLISAFVGGLGATDNATIRVEVSGDGLNFTTIDTFDTEEARSFGRTSADRHQRKFEAVKHFWIEFDTEDRVTHLRLTNLGGTAEGLRLDAVEGLHPDVGSARAFEVRFERYRVDASERFLIRLKNISDPSTGQSITGFHLEKLPVNEWMEDTIWSLLESQGDGSMFCIANCVGDADALPGVHSATWAYSLDNFVPAPAGVGLEPGRQAAHDRFKNVDIDAGGTYLSGFTFRVDFADGVSVPFDFDGDVVGFGNFGALYQKYTFFSDTPSLSGPRVVHHFESVEIIRVPGLAFRSLAILVAALLGVGAVALTFRRRSAD